MTRPTDKNGISRTGIFCSSLSLSYFRVERSCKVDEYLLSGLMLQPVYRFLRVKNYPILATVMQRTKRLSDSSVSDIFLRQRREPESMTINSAAIHLTCDVTMSTRQRLITLITSFHFSIILKISFDRYGYPRLPHIANWTKLPCVGTAHNSP